MFTLPPYKSTEAPFKRRSMILKFDQSDPIDHLFQVSKDVNKFSEVDRESSMFIRAVSNKNTAHGDAGVLGESSEKTIFV